MNDLFTIEEQEQYQLERERLCKLVDVKETNNEILKEKMNRLRGGFYEKYIMYKDNKTITEDECMLIKTVFEHVEILIRMLFEHIEENWVKKQED